MNLKTLSIVKNNELIDEAERMFGPDWNLLMSIRGYVSTRSGSHRDVHQAKKNNIRKKDVFFICCSWPFLLTGKPFQTQGVGRSAETVFACVRNTCRGMTRIYLF